MWCNMKHGPSLAGCEPESASRPTPPWPVQTAFAALFPQESPPPSPQGHCGKCSPDPRKSLGGIRTSPHSPGTSSTRPSASPPRRTAHRSAPSRHRSSPSARPDPAVPRTSRDASHPPATARPSALSTLADDDAHAALASPIIARPPSAIDAASPPTPPSPPPPNTPPPASDRSRHTPPNTAPTPARAAPNNPDGSTAGHAADAPPPHLLQLCNAPNPLRLPIAHRHQLTRLSQTKLSRLHLRHHHQPTTLPLAHPQHLHA